MGLNFQGSIQIVGYRKAWAQASLLIFLAKKDLSCDFLRRGKHDL